jgi:hypothetical protein
MLHYRLPGQLIFDIMSTYGSRNGRVQCERESDRIQRFFVRPFFLSVTIGIPFCVFKLLFGMSAVRAGTPADHFLSVSGWIVIGWAAADLTMNVGRSVLDLTGQAAPFEYCTIAQAGRIVQMPMVFLAVDTVLSFSIICFMLWSGWITALTTSESYLWYFATTLNLISLSMVSLYNEYRRV